MEQIIDNILSMNPTWIYVVTILIAYIENIFPPFPSDVILLASGYLCASGRIDFLTILLISTVGSTTGFMTMYKIGEWFGLKVIESGRFKFIQLDKIRKVEKWFHKYGYLVVIVNRFLAGTRAVVSFFAGMSKLSLWKTTILAAISSLVWNAILLSIGNIVGANWRVISYYLEIYGKIITIIIILIILLYITRSYLIKHKLVKNTSSNK